MKRLIISVVCCVLAGCATTPPSIPVQKVVTVQTPVPVVPKPPAVITCNLLVNQLTLADRAHPGIVGQAYKHDMLCLREQTAQQQQILSVYTKLSSESHLTIQQVNSAFQAISK